TDDDLLVDPATGASRLIASGGYVVAVGATRVFALLHFVAGSGTGDLTLIDLDTGRQTLVAENVAGYSLERAPTGPGDPLAPGLRVAYLVRNRIASPWDGVWVATFP